MSYPWGTGGTRMSRHTSRPTCKARIQALPKVKLLGYYSDAYKLEFILPKFNMYRRILAETLAEECVRGEVGPSSEPFSLVKSSSLTIPEEYLGETDRVRAPRFDPDGNDGHVLGTRRALTASGVREEPVPIHSWCP